MRRDGRRQSLRTRSKDDDRVADASVAYRLYPTDAVGEDGADHDAGLGRDPLGHAVHAGARRQVKELSVGAPKVRRIAGRDPPAVALLVGAHLIGAAAAPLAAAATEAGLDNDAVAHGYLPAFGGGRSHLLDAADDFVA